MMNLNLSLLLRLLGASELYTDTQKTAIRAKLETVSDVKKTELQAILENEQKIKTEYFKKLVVIRKRAAQKKMRIMYQTAEKTSHKQEEEEMSNLDYQLAHL